VIDRSAWDVEARLGLLDAIGVEAQILYPNGIGFASNHIFAIEDIELRSAILTMYNDFFVDVQANRTTACSPRRSCPCGTWTSRSGR